MSSLDIGKCSRMMCPDEVYAVRMSEWEFCRIFYKLFIYI